MCGAFGYVGKSENIEKAYGKKLKIPDEEIKKYFIQVTQKAFVLTDKEPNLLQEFEFGFAPTWSPKRLYLLNVRSEEILTKPSFRLAIHNQRCIIPATHFIEGTTNESFKKPYCVHLIYRPFFMAGIYSTWFNKTTNESINTFAIITTEANQVLKSIPHHRSPVIIPKGYESAYLKQGIHLSDITRFFNPLPDKMMDAYPIKPINIKSDLNNKETILPIGKSYWTLKREQYKIESDELEALRKSIDDKKRYH